MSCRALEMSLTPSLVVFCGCECSMIEVVSSPALHHSPLRRLKYRRDERDDLREA